MEKKGFTLIELLAVIAILGVIAGIAVASVIGVQNSIKDKMYAEKIEMIEEAAKLKGEDNKNDIISSSKKYDEYSCENYFVKGLVPQYLDKDSDSCTLGSNCIVDPRDNNNFLDNLNVIIYYKNKRIYAKVLDASNCS